MLIIGVVLTIGLILCFVFAWLLPQILKEMQKNRSKGIKAPKTMQEAIDMHREHSSDKS